MRLCDAKKIENWKALMLKRKVRLFRNMFNGIWAFSKRYASEAPTPS